MSPHSWYKSGLPPESMFNYLIQYVYFNSLYILKSPNVKFKEKLCEGTNESSPFTKYLSLLAARLQVTAPLFSQILTADFLKTQLNSHTHVMHLPFLSCFFELHGEKIFILRFRPG